MAERRIELRNFGVFEVKRRAPRKARNPRTGDKVFVPEKYVVTFKPGKEMEERVKDVGASGRCSRKGCPGKDANQAGVATCWCDNRLRHWTGSFVGVPRNLDRVTRHADDRFSLHRSTEYCAFRADVSYLGRSWSGLMRVYT